jgi:methylenetetrahydrofolate dehydrogenase (NADP+)/methenyltetrahydrofolate cyclohydrolase
VQGGVGPVTVATQMKNAVLATRMQKDNYRDSYARTDV